MKRIFYSLLLLTLFAATKTFAQPSQDINDYVLFAEKKLGFKGRDCVCPENGVIQGGNVGVNNCSVSNDATLMFGGPVRMPDNGSYVVADKAGIDQGSDIYRLYANATTSGFNASVLRNPPVLPWSPCPLLNWAAIPFPVFVPSANAADDKIIPDGGSLVLAPGTYRDLWVKDGGTLTLSPGVYNFRHIRSGKHVNILTSGTIEIRSAQGLNMGNDLFVGPSNSVKFFVRSDGIDPNNDVSVNFGKQSVFHGSVFAPNGHMNLGHATDLYGKFWAQTISSDFNVSIFNPTSCLPTTDGDERCDPGVVNLKAFGCTDCTILNWYENPAGGNPIFTGDAYSPNLQTTKSYWVTCTGPDGESTPRVEVTGTIYNPNIQIEKALTPPTCGLQPCDGAINITVTGGATPYTFKWTSTTYPGFLRITEDITGLCEGDYTVEVTDDNGCKTSINAGFLCEPNLCPIPQGISQNPFTYALFAYDELIFKGGNKAAGWGKISGDIGVNFAGLSPTGWSLSFATSNYAYMANGYKAIADNTRADAAGSFWDLYTNTKNPSFAATIRNNWIHPVSFPIIQPAALPPLPFTACQVINIPAISVGGNTATYVGPTKSFAPGTYGNMRFNDGTTITFSTGTYLIRDVSIGKNVTFIVTDGTILNVVYGFTNNDNFKFGLGTNNLAQINVGACGFNVNTTRVTNFSHGSEIHGIYFAPTGWLDLGGGNNLFGHFVAQRITGDPNNNVFGGCPDAVFPKNNISPITADTNPFEVKVLTNPSSQAFRLLVQSSSDESISINLMDISGRVVGKTNAMKNVPVTVGENFQAGIYYAEVMQGKDKKVVRLVKL